MKIKFTETVYDLITRDLEDARLNLTLLKGEKTVQEIENEIRESEGITILNNEENVIVTYTGFTDIIVVKDYESAISVELINNFLLQETMELAGRVADLEESTSNLDTRANNLDSITQELQSDTLDLNESQNNQDKIIEDILGTI